MAPKVICIANQKGGVGKTTTTISLAHGLARAGKQVLVIDLDPQGNCATALNLNPESGAFYLLTMGVTQQDTMYVKSFVRQTGRDGLSLIAGNRETSGAQVMLNAMEKPLNHIADVIKRFKLNGLNYILFDTSPSMGGIQERAVWASDLVIVPAAADYLATDGVRQMLELLARLQNEKQWGGALLGVLPTFIEDNVREHKAGLADLRRLLANASGRPEDNLGNLLLPVIHKAATLRECPGAGATIFEKDPDSRPAQEYQALVKLVLKY